ncbi:MAG: methionyl-tRNA formyltransferase [Clostridiaceae bacterium]|nr:methionyl-tRNA formyltransferase [Clostridiaceae bacterium]
MDEILTTSKVKRIIFMGTPDFAVPALLALVEQGFNIVAVISQPNRPQGRKQKIVPTPVAKVAKKYNLLLLQPESINQPQIIQRVISLQPDLIITAAYGQILRQNVLDIPQYGCINIHASLLPLYRGAAPINAVIIDGRTETGITIMQMDQGCDTGNILLQKKIPIKHDATAGSLFAELAELGAKTIVEFLPQFFADNIIPIVQDEQHATYAPKMTRKTGKINWQDSATAIERLIRGTQPWPGCYTYYVGQRMKIFAAEVILQDSMLGKPGELLSCDGGLIIQCGVDAIKLKEIQIASGRQMSTEICAHNYLPGTILGKDSLRKGE